MTGDPSKEYGTNKPPPTGRVCEWLKGDTACPSTSQNPSRQNPSWLSNVCTTRKDPELEWLAKDHQETNPITIKPETTSHVAELVSWVPLPYCSLPGCPFPIKYLALSAHVSPRTIHFQVLDKSPVSGPGRGPPSCNSYLIWILNSGYQDWDSLLNPQVDSNSFIKQIYLAELFRRWKLIYVHHLALCLYSRLSISVNRMERTDCFHCTIYHLIQGTWTSVDLGIHGGSWNQSLMNIEGQLNMSSMKQSIKNVAS